MEEGGGGGSCERSIQKQCIITIIHSVYHTVGSV